MAPRDLHPEVVQRRLVSMRELLDDLDALGSRSVPEGRASFELAGELGLLPESLVVALRPSVGLRSVLVVAYADVDEQVVTNAVPLALRDYGAYVVAVTAWLGQR